MPRKRARLRDLGTGTAVVPPPPPVPRSVAPPPVVPNEKDLGTVRLAPPPCPPPLRPPLLKAGGRPQPYATKEWVERKFGDIRAAIAERFANLRRVDDPLPQTIYAIRDRQDKVVDNINTLVQED